MFPNSVFAHPVSSFQTPVRVPGVDPYPDDLVGVFFNKAWLPYVVGALYQLLLQSTWKVDNDSQLDTVQGQAFDLINLFAIAASQSTNKLITGVSINDMNELTQIVKENGVCKFQFRCCVDDDWTTVATSADINAISQPGTGNPQPKPGGGTAQTCTKLLANGNVLLPALVNTGDQITLDSASGSGWDGGEFDFGPLWRLPNGNQFVGGLDVGLPRPGVSGDPTSANHMSIVAAIGSTPTYLSLPIGTTVTVPGGVSNAQVYVQVNDSVISNNQGSYDICVTIKNNQAAQWSHTFDFTASPQGFAQVGSIISSGTWNLGAGWVVTDAQDTASTWFRSMYIQRTGISAFEILSATIVLDYTSGNYQSPPQEALLLRSSDGSMFNNFVNLDNTQISTGANQSKAGFGDNTGQTLLQIYVTTDENSSSPSGFIGAATVKSLTVTGKGTEPVW